MPAAAITSKKGTMNSTITSNSSMCGSPGRVRHNPYGQARTSPATQGDAATPADAAGTPVTQSGVMMPAAFSESFGQPSTPPTMAEAPAPWAMHSMNDSHASAANHSGYDAEAGLGSHQASGYGAMFEHGPMPGYAQQYVMPAYDSVDPSVAVMMYNAASQAAAQAAAQRGGMYQGDEGFHGMYQYPSVDHYTAHRGGKPQAGSRGGRNGAGRGSSSKTDPFGGAEGTSASTNVPRFEDLQALAGTLAEHARTASGSSHIQAAVKDSSDPRCLPLIWNELASSLGDLLLDAHGCYVIKTLLERLPAEEVSFVLHSIAADEQLGFSVCTHSLHTRRVVQHIIEHIDGSFLCDLMSRHCADVAMTQQGCIVMQRSMDHAPEGDARDALFDAISKNLVNFAKDPFANYVVQHLMEVGERSETAGAMWKAFRGRVVELACNKFASNVIEKCLFHCTAEVQHEMLVEMYSVGHQMLYNMLQDSFGNYIIQSSIALATFRDISLIDERLRPVLAHTPYGYKIEARLDRRLKGKPVTARAGGNGGDAEMAPKPSAKDAPAKPGARKEKGAPRRPTGAKGAVPAGETPW